MFKFWKKSEENREKVENSIENKDEIIQVGDDKAPSLGETDVDKRDLIEEANATGYGPESVEAGESDIGELNNFTNTVQDDKDSNGVDEKVKKGLFGRLMEGLSKTNNNIMGRVDDILKSYTKIDEDLLEELEEVLITADVGLNTTMDIIGQLRDMIKKRGVTDPLEVRDLLKEIISGILTEGNPKIDIDPSPGIIVMVGVNGVGKTTTIGKLAQKYKNDGKKVMLAAADTFRAAATEQLDIWATRVGVDIIKHHEGADPGAVVFDAIKASQARGVDLLICDTAGRLHNKANLMNELGKIFKIIDREYPEAKKEVLLVVDATTGQNAVSQAKTFKEVANITGIVLTKLDGTAKGGVVLAVKSERSEERRVGKECRSR